jgi:sensor histidine kinase YesM
MIIFPIIMIITLIYQMEETKIYNNTMDFNLKMLKEMSSSLSFFSKGGLSEKKQKLLLAKLSEDSQLNIGSQDLLVTDRIGKKIYATDGDFTNNYLTNKMLHEKLFNRISEHGTFKINTGQNVLVTYYYHSLSNRYFIMFTPIKSIDGKYYFMKELFTVIVLTVLLSVTSIVIISYHLTYPIRKINKEINKLEKDQVNTQFDHDVIIKDEIWEIGIQFDKILGRLKEHIDREYAFEVKSNKAQFLALQSQINPHFLHNALEAINSIAIIENVPVIAQLSRSLSRMFRYNTIQEGEYVTLKEELDHIHNYLNVQCIRFDGLIDKVIEIDEQILDCITVKFMLQPLVENSFAHGFKDLDENGFIHIKGYKENETVVIAIEDNGLGMAEENIIQVNKALSSYERPEKTYNETKGIGIFNVNSRIKIAFGKDYGLSYHALQPKGLSVKVTFPYQK